MSVSIELPQKIEVRDVGPRDGLQSQTRLWSIEERIELINRLAATGMTRIEAVSFVNPIRVPQMANAEEVMAGIERKPGVVYSGIALNARGVERAAEAGVDEVSYIVVASETFNQRNQGATIEQTMAGFEAVAKLAFGAGLKLSAGIGAAFGCPFEGSVAESFVIKLAQRLVDNGAAELVFADTIGAAVPTQVRSLLRAANATLDGGINLGCHFHNTRNTGFANAAAAVEEGVSFLDASVGGIGGCPFAPKATGNIATEDLCFMLRNMGIETGVNLHMLVAIAQWAEAFFEASLPGQIMKAGLFPEVAQELRSETR